MRIHSEKESQRFAARPNHSVTTEQIVLVLILGVFSIVDVTCTLPKRLRNFSVSFAHFGFDLYNFSIKFHFHLF